MIRVWRIVKAKHAADSFDGEGARRAGGRWNSPGRAVIYTSATISLAVLEMLVHLGNSRILDAYLVIPASFDNAEVADVENLPGNWRYYPAPPSLQVIGDQWIESGRSLVLRVPSAVVNREFNYLINPAHEAFGTIEIEEPERFTFDSRLP